MLEDNSTFPDGVAKPVSWNGFGSGPGKNGNCSSNPILKASPRQKS